MVVGELGYICANSKQQCDPTALPNNILSEGAEMLKNVCIKPFHVIHPNVLAFLFEITIHNK